MGWVIRVEHRSAYRYASEVRSSYNEARMTTLTTDRQSTLESRLTVEALPCAPGAARVRARAYRYVDYWATVVHSFDIHVPHSELVVDATSVVETASTPTLRSDLGWGDLAADRVLDGFAEYLAPSTYVGADPGLAGVAAELRTGRSPAEAVAAASAWVSSSLTYTKGVTRVSTSASEVFEARVGVCQDYAHLSLAVLRAMGIPARYVSGYLHPDPDAGHGDSLAGESHAWVEAWLDGWHGLDPTHALPAGERHVVVALGRDYADVPPLKGVYLGGPADELDVDVRITRLA